MANILIAEDDPIQQTLLGKHLSESSHTCTVVGDGQAALEALQSTRYEVLVTDIQMPVMDGLELIRQAGQLPRSPVMIALTSTQEIDTVIDSFRAGVYDYLTKPINSRELLVKIEKAAEHARLREIERRAIREQELRREKQFSWQNWKRDFVEWHQNRMDRILFTNLETAFSQGAGMGALLAIISSLPGHIKRDGESYHVDADLMDLLFENAAVAQKALDIFSELNFLTENELALADQNAADLYRLLERLIAENAELLKIKNQKIILSAYKTDLATAYLKLEIDRLEIAFKEILLNAMKFSEKESEIFVLMNIVSGRCQISFLNKPRPQSGVEGIPPEYEQLVFEPMFRIATHVDEAYKSLDYGLGLSLVDLLIKRHQGEIDITSARDSLGETDRALVNVTINLPLS